MTNREGFWKYESSSLLPLPIERKKWKGQDEFLARLFVLEQHARLIKAMHDNVVRCHFCNCTWNRPHVYEMDGWVWRKSLYHYVKNHNIRPSIAFQEFVLDQRLE